MLVELGVVALLLLLAAIIYEVIARICEPKNMPPGLRISPLLTLLRPRPQKLPFVMLEELGRKFNGVFTLKMGFKNTVVVDNIAVAREALVQRGNDFSGRPRLEIMDLITYGKNIVMGDYGPVWKLQRKIAHSALRVYGSAQGIFEDKVAEEIKYLTERFEKMKGEPIDPRNDISLAMLNVICAIVFGSRYELEDPDFHKLIELNLIVGRLFASGQKLQILPLLKYLPTKLMKEVNEVVTFRDSLVKNQIKEHRETFDRENIRDLTDAFIKATIDAEEEGSEVKKLLTEDHMMLSLMDVFAAGLDTTATTVQWVVAYLATYPQVQRRLQEEIYDIIGRDRLPSLKDKSNLPYVRATITETLRLASTVPILAPHRTTVDTKLQGYDIPKDTDVIFNVWAMQHDSGVWENPTQFDPSRFIGSDGMFFYPNDRSLLPFGAGARVCLGESLAKTELILFLSQLVHQFTFSCPEDSSPPDLNPMFGVVSHPKPYKVNISKRD